MVDKDGCIDLVARAFGGQGGTSHPAPDGPGELGGQLRLLREREDDLLDPLLF